MYKKTTFFSLYSKLIIATCFIINCTLIASSCRHRSENICVLKTDSARRPEPNISSPGPDTANFPTSPFTLPKGVCYFENYPINFELPSSESTRSYSWPYLLRIGLTDYLEFRLTGLGLTNIPLQSSTRSSTGFSPVAFGFKVHLTGSPDIKLIPSTGIEAYIITPLASKNFRDGFQYIINALFCHTIAKNLFLEWNIGAYSRSLSLTQKYSFFVLIEWALQQKISDHLEFFLEGFYSSKSNAQYPTNVVLGAGFLSTLTKQICIFGSYNWPVLKPSLEIANLGFAIAF